MKFIKISDQNYEMQDAPITQAEWQEVMGNNPSHFANKPKRPVERVSWNDVQEFIKKLNEKNDGYIYRLPTEQEWEHCAKSCDEQPVREIAWCWENSSSATKPVRKKLPNALGLYDMLGNVWEWTSSSEGSLRVIRGGSWSNDARHLRSAYRYSYSPGYRLNNLGFRLVRSACPSYPCNIDKSERALSVARKALEEIAEILK